MEVLKLNKSVNKFWEIGGGEGDSCKFSGWEKSCLVSSFYDQYQRVNLGEESFVCVLAAGSFLDMKMN